MRTHPPITLPEVLADRDRLLHEAAEVAEALMPILYVLRAHDEDTLGQTNPDDTELWSAEGLTTPRVSVTLGHVRRLNAVVMSQGRPELKRALLGLDLSPYRGPREALDAFVAAAHRRWGNAELPWPDSRKEPRHHG